MQFYKYMKNKILVFKTSLGWNYALS